MGAAITQFYLRLHVGASLIKRDVRPEAIKAYWGEGSFASPAVRLAELPLEQAVSQHIRQMPFLWLAVEDVPSSNSQRGVIEAQCHRFTEQL